MNHDLHFSWRSVVTLERLVLVSVLLGGLGVFSAKRLRELVATINPRASSVFSSVESHERFIRACGVFFLLMALFIAAILLSQRAGLAQ